MAMCVHNCQDGGGAVVVVMVVRREEKKILGFILRPFGGFRLV